MGRRLPKYVLREYMLVVLVCVLVCITSRTDHALKRHAWITVTVEFIRAMFCIFIFDVYKDEYDQDSPFPRFDCPGIAAGNGAAGVGGAFGRR